MVTFIPALKLSIQSRVEKKPAQKSPLLIFQAFAASKMPTSMRAADQKLIVSG
jgi:hypothetical protein